MHTCLAAACDCWSARTLVPAWAASAAIHLCVASSGLGLLTCAAPAWAQSGGGTLEAQEVADAGTIDSVVLYTQGAAVTRVVRSPLKQGIWNVRITGLPVGVDANSLQASLAKQADAGSGGPPPVAKLMGVEYQETPLSDFGGTPEGVALAKRLRDLQRTMEYLKQDDALLEAQGKLLDLVGFRPTATAPSANPGATQDLNLDAVQKQLLFVAERRAAITLARRELVLKFQETQRQAQKVQQELDARGGADHTARSAVVTLAVPEDTTLALHVTYIVANAGWSPTYNVRAAGDRSSVQIEYDAVIRQATGEDWKDVMVSLSTAQPGRSSEPPPVTPWFLDVYVPPPPVSAPTRALSGIDFDEPAAGEAGTGGDVRYGYAPGSPGGANKLAIERRKQDIDRLGRAADVQEAGTAVSYDLPRRLTLPTDNDKTQRTRIATVDPTSKFVYGAQPLVTEDVFLRGDLTNSSAYQLLPGPAQIFMGGDFIGQTGMPSVAPKDEFSVYFGPDRALKATRQLVSKTTGNAGFFGSDTAVVWNYRVSIDNSTGRAVSVELYDRQPVSRNEKITVELSKLSSPLSTDKAYVEGLKTQGILRWDLAVPATARGDAAQQVTWTVTLSHPNKVETTPLPQD